MKLTICDWCEKPIVTVEDGYYPIVELKHDTKGYFRIDVIPNEKKDFHTKCVMFMLNQPYATRKR